MTQDENIQRILDQLQGGMPPSEPIGWWEAKRNRLIIRWALLKLDIRAFFRGQPPL